MSSPDEDGPAAGPQETEAGANPLDQFPSEVDFGALQERIARLIERQEASYEARARAGLTLEPEDEGPIGGEPGGFTAKSPVGHKSKAVQRALARVFARMEDGIERVMRHGLDQCVIQDQLAALALLPGYGRTMAQLGLAIAKVKSEAAPKPRRRVHPPSTDESAEDKT